MKKPQPRDGLVFNIVHRLTFGAFYFGMLIGAISQNVPWYVGFLMGIGGAVVIRFYSDRFSRP